MLTDTIPAGEVVPCTTMPDLTNLHTSRLRKLWSYGRPVHLSHLQGIDLDLTVHGLVESVATASSSTAVLAVTKLGVAHLNEARQAVVLTQRPHHSLGQRLALHLRTKGLFTWENIEFTNPAPEGQRSWGVVRPDVFACKPTLKAENAASAIYEVKVHRSDFISDVAKPEKRAAYAQLAQAVYYCCPSGLIDKSEVPDDCGLLVEVSPGAFELRKRARRRAMFAISASTVMTLMVKRQVPLSDLE